MLELNGRTALVTGAARGLGKVFVTELLAQGVRKVYATGRNPEAIDLPGAHVLRLDINDPNSVRVAAAEADDVDIVVNNAGVSLGVNLISGDFEKIRDTMEAHFFGTLRVVREFAPILEKNGGGAILNVLSVLSWAAFDGNNAYAAAKSAQWSLTNGIRLELAAQNTLVSGLMVGPTRTEAFEAFEGAKDVTANEPIDVVQAALNGLRTGSTEIIVDQASRETKALLQGEPRAFIMS